MLVSVVAEVETLAVVPLVPTTYESAATPHIGRTAYVG